MDFTIKDVSVLLTRPEKEIQNLIKANEIPFQIINDKYFFNKQQIVEWALIRNIPINISNHGNMSEYQVKALNTILDRDSFYYDCALTEDSYLEQMLGMVHLDANVDKGIIIQLLKNREALMSTAIGNGISLPHPRIPLMVGRNPLINFFFPQRPLDLKSIDGKPVHTIILLVSQTIKQHLSLLAHLSFLLSQETFRAALENRLSNQDLLDIINHIESTRGA
jgi:PTS system nitrogen regulatory IIA component